MALPLETALVNSVGLQHVLELARAHGGRVLFASTSEIYGDPLQHPQREDYWGNVSSIGPAQLLRRGQALRRSAVHDLRALAGRRRAAHSHLQHVRPEHGP